LGPLSRFRGRHGRKGRSLHDNQRHAHPPGAARPDGSPLVGGVGGADAQGAAERPPKLPAVSFFSWLSTLGPSAADIRAEVWKLGVQHRGEPLQGALDELAAGGVSASRTVLLKACVHQLRRA
jgi:hypothetical protein